MDKILNCRRSLIAIFAICCLTALGFISPPALPQIAQSIALICMGVAGANSYQGNVEAKAKKETDDGK